MGQLLRIESARTIERRPAAPGLDQQARQLNDALAVGGSRPDGRAVRSGTAPRLSAMEVPSHGGVAKIAIARKLAVRLYWMLRTKCDYAQLVGMQGSPRRNLVETTPSRF
jgi:hypothetical protein